MYEYFTFMKAKHNFEKGVSSNHGPYFIILSFYYIR